MTDAVQLPRAEDDLRGRLDAIEVRLASVLVLHSSRRRDHNGFTEVWCRECQQTWPCPTVQAINGRAG